MTEDPKQSMLAQIAEAEAKGDLSHKAMLEKILKNFVDVPQPATEQKITTIKNNILSASRPEEIANNPLYVDKVNSTVDNMDNLQQNPPSGNTYNYKTNTYVIT